MELVYLQVTPDAKLLTVRRLFLGLKNLNCKQRTPAVLARDASPLRVKNAPACYRAPRCPDPEFPPKIPKNYSPGRNSGTPKNTEKIPKMGIFGVFRAFFFVFSGIRESRL